MTPTSCRTASCSHSGSSHSVAILAQVTAAHMTASASVPRQATSRSRTPSPYQRAPWWAPSPDIVDSQPPSPSPSWSNQGRAISQEFNTDEAVSRAPGEGSETGSQNKDTVDVNDFPQLNPSLGQDGLPPTFTLQPRRTIPWWQEPGVLVKPADVAPLAHDHMKRSPAHAIEATTVKSRRLRYEAALGSQTVGLV